MMVATTDTLPGREVKEVLGVVFGSCVQTKHLGKDLVLQFGGGIHGHPKGTLRGAVAARQAVQAVLENKTLKQYSKDHIELKEALDYWE